MFRLGTRKNRIPFVLLNHTVLKDQTNIKRLSFDFLFDTDNKQSDPIDRCPVRSESRFFNDFIIGVKSYMRVTNVTLDYIIGGVKMLAVAVEVAVLMILRAKVSASTGRSPAWFTLVP